MSSDYKKQLKAEQAKCCVFETNPRRAIVHDIKEYKKYLKTLHHHEILPNRLYLIGKIQKAITESEKILYKKRYEILQEMNPNHSWDEYVRKL